MPETPKMPETYQVEWSFPAEEDLNEIVSYIAQDSVTNALAVAKRLEKRAASLVESPERGRVVPELSQFGYTQYRELIEKPWRIVYRIAAKTVYILVVIDGRRDVQSIIMSKVLRRRLQ